ncbi:YkvA family protein [Saccharopolyspora taberi]|uniref:DUF1232 domain-containing protein n=1 Tax=Saccharopolyspora taberi TaxID=60895 RepID=A0ABN3VDE0_9PSEU
MIVFGVLLVAAGVVAYLAGLGDPAGGWWLLPPGLIAAGIGIAVAGLVARVRRRLAPLRRSGEGATGGPVQRIRAVPAMIAESWRGGAGVPRYQTLLWLLAVVYLVSPIDFVPEFLPLIGVGDDIGVGAWLLSSLYAESGNYLGRRRAG